MQVPATRQQRLVRPADPIRQPLGNNGSVRPGSQVDQATIFVIAATIWVLGNGSSVAATSKMSEQLWALYRYGLYGYGLHTYDLYIHGQYIIHVGAALCSANPDRRSGSGTSIVAARFGGLRRQKAGPLLVSFSPSCRQPVCAAVAQFGVKLVSISLNKITTLGEYPTFHETNFTSSN